MTNWASELYRRAWDELAELARSLQTPRPQHVVLEAEEVTDDE